MRTIEVTYVGGPFDGETDETDRHLDARWVMILPTKRGRYRLVETVSHNTVEWIEDE